jgi:hypothetical protein
VSDNWALPDEVFSFLRHRLTASSAVVELGSGTGTARLVQMFGRVHTVEHDPAWLNKVEGAHYIHAPILGEWYDPDALKALPKTYDCLIVDGPPGYIGRSGMGWYLSLFNPVPTVVDDVHRKPEFDLAVAIAKARKTDLSIHYLRNGRAFATLGWPEF